MKKSVTSGGGFSNFYARQPWQDDAVKTYFKNAIAEGKDPAAGYNAGGRGYPDISVCGANFFIWLIREDIPNGFLGGVAGTSASCPVAAAFISNINAGRIAAGKGSVGWLNPTLNVYRESFVNDVTVGNNNCVIGGPPCQTGFTATAGWDPASGWGSVNYAKMHKTLIALGNVNAASIVPTLAPVSAPPTNRPSSGQPSSMPTTPNKLPMYPTRPPTRRPVNAPTGIPTSLPTPAPIALLAPTMKPTAPTKAPITAVPTFKAGSPTPIPTSKPSNPSFKPTMFPTGRRKTVLKVMQVNTANFSLS
jgi:hypothetical protein